MSEEQQTAAEPGIDYAKLGLGDDIPGIVPLVEVKTPHTVGFGIDALGEWRIEVHTADGTALDAAQWWTAHVDDGDDTVGEDDDGAVIDLSAYPVDSPAGAVALQEELGRRFPEATIIWKPGVMNSLDEHRAAAHRALAAAAADRIAARTATAKAEKSLREALPLAEAAGLGPGEIATRTGYARSTVTKAQNAQDGPPCPRPRNSRSSGLTYPRTTTAPAVRGRPPGRNTSIVRPRRAQRRFFGERRASQVSAARPSPRRRHPGLRLVFLVARDAGKRPAQPWCQIM